MSGTRKCVLAAVLVAAWSAAAQSVAAQSGPDPVAARLLVAGDSAVLRLRIADGWSIIAPGDTLTGRPLVVTWRGRDLVSRAAPRAVDYATPAGPTSVYRGEIELIATGRVTGAHVRYVACAAVCIDGTIEVRPERRRRLRE